ncbi:MAG TPA: RsmE family RNA methyltransferase [Actinomycetota bacterium]|jgi:16S rRNA (uracil1498-N3)-methyltransferase|nr:RsmE family RNA methyltransferase [Actinomycetota bacterium]
MSRDGAAWFVAPPDRWTATHVSLPRDESHHARRSLRVSASDLITVTDGAGRVARCAVERVEDDVILAAILDHERRPRPVPEIVVYQGAPKGGKSDDVVERLAELGVSATWIFSSERAVVNWDDAKRSRRAARWEAIARGAAKQSRNPYVMATGPPISWTTLVHRVTNETSTIVLWERATLPLRTALDPPARRIALIVGPEGGLSRGEAEALADAGGRLVSLGPRILRTENAAFAAVAALQFHYGLIG